MLSSCHTKVPVVVSIISDEVLFNQSWRYTCSTTAGKEERLPLQLVKCFFHLRWSSTFSIAGGHVRFPLQLVNYFFHCSWS